MLCGSCRAEHRKHSKISNKTEKIKERQGTAEDRMYCRRDIFPCTHRAIQQLEKLLRQTHARTQTHTRTHTDTHTRGVKGTSDQRVERGLQESFL